MKETELSLNSPVHEFCKLMEWEGRKIRKLHKDGIPHYEIAEKFGVSIICIKIAVYGANWGNHVH